MAEERNMVPYHSQDPVEETYQTGRALGVYALSIATLAFLGLLAYVVWLVHMYLIYLGYLVLGGAAIVIVCLVATPIIYLLRLLFKADVHHIGQYGIAFKSPFGRPLAIAPQSAANGTKFAQGGKQGSKKDVPAIPMLSMLEMIEQGIICPGQTRVVLGYTRAGEVEVRNRPNVYVIAGKGRSGKSRRATMMIGQDLIGLAPLMNFPERKQGARVIICDPHGLGKRDSLRKLLESLSAWVEFASTEAEVRRYVGEYIEEMEARINNRSTLGLEDGRYLPWVIFFDEWSRFMTKYDDDFTELLIACVQSASQEYAGVDGYVALIGQDWVNDSCGGTAIRRAIHEAFIHNISSEYAAFFLKGMSGRKWAAKAESLRVKDCIYKDYNGQVTELVTPHVGDDVPAKLAALMQELCPLPRTELPTFADGLVHPKSDPRARYADEEAYPSGRSTGPLHPLPEQLASHYPLLSERVNTPMSEQGESENGLHRQDETHSVAPVQGETFTMIDAQATPVYTHEQEVLVLNAAFQLARETGKITRSDIMERLGWNRKQWPIIKAVCDLHNIAKQ